MKRTNIYGALLVVVLCCIIINVLILGKFTTSTYSCSSCCDGMRVVSVFSNNTVTNMMVSGEKQTLETICQSFRDPKSTFIRLTTLNATPSNLVSCHADNLAGSRSADIVLFVTAFLMNLVFIGVLLNESSMLVSDLNHLPYHQYHQCSGKEYVIFIIVVILYIFSFSSFCHLVLTAAAWQPSSVTYLNGAILVPFNGTVPSSSNNCTNNFACLDQVCALYRQPGIDFIDLFPPYEHGLPSMCQFDSKYDYVIRLLTQPFWGITIMIILFTSLVTIAITNGCVMYYISQHPINDEPHKQWNYQATGLYHDT